MSLFETMEKRRNQRKGNEFIRTFSNKTENEVKQLYLDSKDFTNNEVVLSHLFFTYPSIISVLPLDYQKKMINSNFAMFKYGSDEAKRSLVSDWLNANKFIINSKSLHLSQEEYESYICMYFNQPEDIIKLYMEDITQVISILYKNDAKQTEELIEKIKDDLNERQWDFVLKVHPSLIKYASQNVQNKYGEEEEFSKYVSGEARDKYINKQLEKLKRDNSLLKDESIDIQREYINNCPYMINYVDEEILINLLKYDTSLIKYVNIPSLKNREVLYSVLENSKSKGVNDIVNIFVDKGLLNAKCKLYRYDKNSNNVSYQYTKRIIKIIQSLSIDQIISLINIDVNYVLPYLVPIYGEKTDIEEKKNIALEYNSICLNLFKAYYGEIIYSKYYKTINKIYSEFISNIEKYDYQSDYNSIFDLFKVLFNRKIIEKNNPEKITVFIGISLLYKGKENESTINASIKLLNDLLSNAYDKNINLSNELYEIGSLEIFDSCLGFISSDLLMEFTKYNFINMSTLLFIVKNQNTRESFKYYYNILKVAFKENKETLFRAIENFTYYKDLINDVKDKELNDKEIDALISLIVSNGNYLNISKKEQLDNVDFKLLKNLVKDISETNNEEIHKNLFCNYFFNKSYNTKGNAGWLEQSTLEQICDVYEIDAIKGLEINGEKVFDDNEINMFTMIKLIIGTNDSELLLSFVLEAMNKKIKRNIIPMINFIDKLKTYRCEIINSEIVTLDDIETLYESNPNAVTKTEENGVTIYNFNNQDFKILSSYTNNGIHYSCMKVSELEKNCFGYNKFIKEGSVRFTTFEGKTLIKLNKDKKIIARRNPDFIVAKAGINDNLIELARRNNLAIIVLNNE